MDDLCSGLIKGNVMGYNPNEPRDKDGKWTTGGGGGGMKRWGRMSSTEKARLTTSAQFSTKTKPGKAGKLPALGKTSPRNLPAGFGEKYQPSAHAVAIETSKALNKDFHAARDKANKEAMGLAIASSKVAITKLPPGKPPKYGPKGKMK